VQSDGDAEKDEQPAELDRTEHRQQPERDDGQRLDQGLGVDDRVVTDEVDDLLALAREEVALDVLVRQALEQEIDHE
jgi:hypothetical protein